MSWNPDLYNKFKKERYAPFHDLIKMIEVHPGIHGIDLGCGTGELTGMLSKHLPGSSLFGIDSSPEMLSKAAAFSSPGLQFEVRTIQEQIAIGTKWDLVFSNAALQWVDHHDCLIPSIISLLNRNGQIVIQVPSNHDHFTQVSLIDMAMKEPFRSALNGWKRKSPVLGIGEYARIFYDLGGAEIQVFEKVYPHVLPDADSLYEWVSGTALIPYLEKLPVDLKTVFQQQYRKTITDEYKVFPVFFPFQRTLMKAVF